MLYTVRSAIIRPELKGGWESPAWEHADTLEATHFCPESSEHRPQTFARLLHTREGLFGIFLVKDRYVRCVRTLYNDFVSNDSCVEFFVQPKAEMGYFNFEFNCGGVLLSNYVVDGTRAPGGFKEFTPLPETDGRKLAVYHSMPQLVEPEITAPTEWVLEFYVPFALLAKYVGPLGNAQGQAWRANFYKCGDETSHPHWASWSRLDELNFRLPGCFGSIRFSDGGGTENSWVGEGLVR